MVTISIIISAIYALLIIAFIIGFDRVKLFKNNTENSINTFTIVIPFRNEAENLSELLESLILIEYPKEKYEIILVDDDSSDNSVEIIKKFNTQYPTLNTYILKNIRKSNSPKKDAIETAINQAKNDWIVTTDADCAVPIKWLQTFNTFIQQNNCKMICAPVTYNVKNNLLEQFQLLDFMSLIGATIGGFGIEKPFLNNGANLCYSKDAFFLVNGFEGNNNISSGDDIFLLEKMTKRFPTQVHFLKSMDALVRTNPETTLKNLISQRVRWASKTVSYNNWFGKFAGISVLLMNFLILILLILVFLKIFSWNFFLKIFFLKFLIDFILISKTLIFTKQSKKIIFYPIIAVFYPFFSVFIVFLPTFKNGFKWKQRTIKT